MDVEKDVNECLGLNAQESPVVRGEPGVEGVVGHLHPGSTSWKKVGFRFRELLITQPRTNIFLPLPGGVAADVVARGLEPALDGLAYHGVLGLDPSRRLQALRHELRREGGNHK